MILVFSAVLLTTFFVTTPSHAQGWQPPGWTNPNNNPGPPMPSDRILERELSPGTTSRATTPKRKTDDVVLVSRHLQEEAKQKTGELGDILQKMSVAVEKDKELEKEKQRLLSTAGLVRNAKNNVEKEINDWNEEHARHHQAVQAHEGRGCIGGTSSTNIPFVNSCNAETGQLNAWYTRLADRKKTIDMKAEAVLQESRNLSQATTAWAQKVKTNNGDLNQLQARRQAIQARLAELKNMVDTCRELLQKEHPRTKDEELKLKCGNVQFDNADPNLPPLLK